MFKFTIGDTVEIENDSQYHLTKKGSFGEIVNINYSAKIAIVRFQFIPGYQIERQVPSTCTFTISIKDLKLKGQRTNYSLQEQICLKIKTMEQRRYNLHNPPF